MATPVRYAMQNEGKALPWVLLAVVVLLLIALICVADRDPKMVRRLISSGAPVCPNPVSGSDTTQLRACINSLSFDTVAASGDEQRLLVLGTVGAGAACPWDPNHSCRHGPLAKIEPVIGADERDASALDQGAIIARLFLRE